MLTAMFMMVRVAEQVRQLIRLDLNSVIFIHLQYSTCLLFTWLRFLSLFHMPGKNVISVVLVFFLKCEKQMLFPPYPSLLE